MSNDFTPSALTAAPDQFVARCKLMLLFCSLLIAVTASAQERIYPRPILVPVPGANAGDSSKIVSLSGAWQWHAAPQGEYWLPGSGDAGWVATTVPGGRRGERPEGIYAYRKRILIPASFTGQQAILRFDGVSNKARLWVNGKMMCEHWGSFMAWTCDITANITPGKEALIVLEVDDRPVGLAKFVRAGGIQREVRLFAVPANYLQRLSVETDLDKDYKNAVLKVRLKMAFNRGNDSRVRLVLRDGTGKVVPLRAATVTLNRKADERVVEIPVTAPLKWDAEHPNLYSIEAIVLNEKGQEMEVVRRAIGFREVELRGAQVLVNGKEVKLRGVWGGNIAGLKAVNANHTRQLWATEELLDEADRKGMYVLDEIPVDFAKYGVESDPRYAGQWLGFIAELMERDYSHPSIIMWGLANESFHGANTLAMHHYVKAEDPQRPTMHSWANRVPTSKELPYDIYSSHYPNLNDPNLDLGDFTVAKWHSTSLVKERNPRPSIPVLHDEYSHTVLNRALIDRDPNVRNFWGESIFRYWEKMVATPGALGGDIFGLERGGPGSAEPELAKKAYCPVRIANRPLAIPEPGQELMIPVMNWFDHTNLNEVTVSWASGAAKGTFPGPDVAPRGSGLIRIPANSWKKGDQLRLSVTDAGGRELDQWLLTIAPEPIVIPAPSGPPPALEKTDREFIVTGKDFKIVFDRAKGLISDGSYKGQTVIIDGPFIELLGSGLAVSEWWCDSISAATEGNEVVVKIRGNYAVIVGGFDVRIDGTGLITTKYTIDFVPGEPPPPTFSPWDATSVGGYSEVGASYLLPADAQALSWQRKGLWSIYPEQHLGRNEGRGLRGSLDFRATKESIVSATAEVGSAGLTALSDGRAAVRLFDFAGTGALPKGTRMAVLNEWNYPDIGLNNYTKPPVLIRNGYANTIYVRMSSLAGIKR